MRRRIAAWASAGAAAICATAMVVMVDVMPAAATSCAYAPSVSQSIADGNTVFVGTAVSTTNHGRWATFVVEEVWSGEPGDRQVVKAGMPPDPDPNRYAAIGGEHTFQPGARYLVDAHLPDLATFEGLYANEEFPFQAGDLADSPCSATMAWDEALAVDRPSSAREITPDEPVTIVGEVPDPDPVDPNSAAAGSDPNAAESGSSNGTRVLVGAAIVAIAALCLFLLFRRGSIADRAKVDAADPGPSSPPQERRGA